MRLQQVAIIIGTLWLGLCTHAPRAQEVAVVLGNTIELSQISPDEKELKNMTHNASVSKEVALVGFRQHQLTQIIVDTVLKDYADKQGITTDLQLAKQFTERFRTSVASSSETTDLHKVARQQVGSWQVDKALYQQHGGAVVFTPRKPLFPVEAYNTVLRRYQNDGLLTIHNPDLRAGFWQTFEPPYEFEIPAAQVSFAQPWWLTTDIMP